MAPRDLRSGALTCVTMIGGLTLWVGADCADRGPGSGGRGSATAPTSVVPRVRPISPPRSVRQPRSVHPPRSAALPRQAASETPAAASATGSGSWPAGRALSLADALGPCAGRPSAALRGSEPWVYRFTPGLGPDRPILLIGLPGARGHARVFIDHLARGLEGTAVAPRLLLAALHDPHTRGPLFQGQMHPLHANFYVNPERSAPTLRELVVLVNAAWRGCKERGPTAPLEVYLVGYSSGGKAAPYFAAYLAASALPGVAVRGAVCLASGSAVPGALVVRHGLRVLFLTAPARGPRMESAVADDKNRNAAHVAAAALRCSGAQVQLREVPSARWVPFWHFGVVSQGVAYDNTGKPGVREVGPDYGKPNPETYRVVAEFLGAEPSGGGR